MTAQEVIATLPPYCFSVLLSDRSVIMIKAGVTGYFPAHKDPPPLSADESLEDFVNESNLELGVDYPTRHAMEDGSMYGWDIPAANPEFWRSHFDVNPDVVKKLKIEKYMRVEKVSV